MTTTTTTFHVRPRPTVIAKLFRWFSILLGVWVVIFLAVRIHRAYGVKQAMVSASNLREIGVALAMYANGPEKQYPHRLSDLLTDSQIPTQFFVVPWGSATPATGATRLQQAQQMAAGGHCSYGYLGAGHSENDFTSDMVIVYEADAPNPGGGISCLFGDGRVAFLTVPQAIQAIIDTVQKLPHPTTAPSATMP